jgi:protein phosphatase 1 regulatory subunit 14B
MDYHGRMENPLSTRVIAASHDKGTASSSDKHNANKTSLHVGFSEEKGEVKEKRERFLTAKYGVSASCQKAISQTSTWILLINKVCLFTLSSWQSHQMALIRKRLAVEMWIYEQLNELYGCTVSLHY